MRFHYYGAITGMLLCLVAAGGCRALDSSYRNDEALAILDRIEVPPPSDISSYRAKYLGGLSQVTFSRVGDNYGSDLDPTGAWMAFVSTRNTRQPQIYLKNLKGGTAVTLKTNQATPCIHPRFSPDGRYIAYASYRNGNYDIWVMDAHRNTAHRQITKTGFHELHPSWSPDGKKIAFMAYTDRGEWDIQFIDLTTYQTDSVATGLFPEWSPVQGDDTLVFQKARGRDVPWYGVWTVKTDGSQLTEVVAEADWAAIEPSWSPDGKWIVFTSVYKSIESRKENRKTRGDDVWIVRRDGTGQRRLTTDSRPDWSPRWGPDRKIYFSSTRNHSANIWTVNVPDLAVTDSSGAAADADKLLQEADELLGAGE